MSKSVHLIIGILMILGGGGTLIGSITNKAGIIVGQTEAFPGDPKRRRNFGIWGAFILILGIGYVLFALSLP